MFTVCAFFRSGVCRGEGSRGCRHEGLSVRACLGGSGGIFKINGKLTLSVVGQDRGVPAELELLNGEALGNDVLSLLSTHLG